MGRPLACHLLRWCQAMTDFLADPRHDLSCSSVPPRPDLEATSHLDVRPVGRLRSPGAAFDGFHDTPGDRKTRVLRPT